MYALFTAYIRASVIGGVIALILMALRGPLSRFAGLIWREAAFSALAFFLLVPLWFSIPVQSAVQMPDAVQSAVEWTQRGTETLTAFVRAELPEAGVGEQEAQFPVIMLVWLAGIALTLCGKAISAHRIRSKTGAAPLDDERARIALRKICEEMGLRSIPDMRLSREGPAVRGVLRPQILLTEAALSCSDETLIFVICHECAHIARLDTLRLALLQVMVALHWWNPAIRLLARRMRADMELFCDRSVLRHIGSGRRSDYGHSLVEIASRPSNATYPGAAEHPLKERMKMLMMSKQKRWIAVLAASLCVLIPCAFIFRLTPAIKDSQAAPFLGVETDGVSYIRTPISPSQPPTPAISNATFPAPLPTPSPSSAVNLDTAATPMPAPQFGEILSWEEADALWPIGGSAAVVDFRTKKSYSVTRVSLPTEIADRPLHADFEPTTDLDTRIMKECYGGEWSWSRRAVLVYIGDRWVAASVNGMPHGEENIAGNDVTGNFCMHFKDSRTHGTQIVDEQHDRMVNAAAGITGGR